jgi:hypothetical protein
MIPNMKQKGERETQSSSSTRKNQFQKRSGTDSSTSTLNSCLGDTPTYQRCSNRCDLISMIRYLSQRGISTFKETSNDNSNTVMQRLEVPVRRRQRQNQQQMHHCEQKLHQLQEPAVPKYIFE